MTHNRSQPVHLYLSLPPRCLCSLYNDPQRVIHVPALRNRHQDIPHLPLDGILGSYIVRFPEGTPAPSVGKIEKKDTDV